MSDWKSMRIRGSVPEGDGKVRVSLWLFDGERGTFSSGSFAESDGAWGYHVHDLTVHQGTVDMSRITEIAVVLHDYQGDSGEIVIDHLEYSEGQP
jgi:hypothetical protein